MNDKPKFDREITTPTVRINGKDRIGLVSQVKETFALDRESLVAMGDALTSKERVFCLIEIHERDTTTIIERQRYVLASDEAGTILRMALDYAERLAQLRRSIAHTEKHTSDAGDLSRFFETLEISLELAGDLEILTIKTKTREIIRGRIESFDGNSSTKADEEREIVRFVRKLKKENPDIGINKAVTYGMEKYRVKKKKVYDLLEKY